MNKENKFKLKRAVNFLKDLHFKTENIMVTGSVALDLQGLLPKDRNIHDVDLIIRMDEQTWRCLKLLEEIYADEDKLTKHLLQDYPMSRKDTVFFDVDGLILNIWKADDEWSDLKESETGIYIATAEHIFKAKKGYARPKDYEDINAIIKNIL